ncbi:MAG TPA: hypothetical protein VNX46_12740 [Candidatus Acidoferrum sp.]|nr:hypothetical protein [Candidatus Acidoferrum sp.]
MPPICREEFNISAARPEISVGAEVGASRKETSLQKACLDFHIIIERKLDMDNEVKLRRWIKRIHRAIGKDYIEPTTSMLLRELFVHYITAGRTIRAALSETIFWAATELSSKMHEGVSLEAAMDAVPVVKSEDLLRAIRSQTNLLHVVPRITKSMGSRIFHLDELLKPEAAAFYVVASGGGTAGIPTPECIESHLPIGRKPTSQELRDAWEACANG